jgi:uncharacterized membrane protein
LFLSGNAADGRGISVDGLLNLRKTAKIRDWAVVTLGDAQIGAIVSGESGSIRYIFKFY